MKYSDCTTEELAKFCTARGLNVEVHWHPKPTTRQIRQTYFTALKTADANPGPFRFSDLYPELRTNIYEKLLVMNQSFTCHAQMLAVSKAVNSEASNILYGQNLVEIKMWRDGVYVHGKLCGYFVWGTPIEVAWPEFLRRVQFLRLAYGADSMGTKFSSAAQRGSARSQRYGSFYAENILYSLCCFLMEGHNLRSIKVDLRLAIDLDDKFDTYALNLLGPLKECIVEGCEGSLVWGGMPDPSCSFSDVTNSVDQEWSFIQKACSTKLQYWNNSAPSSKAAKRIRHYDMIQILATQFSTREELVADLSLFARELRAINETTIFWRSSRWSGHSDTLLHLEILGRIVLQQESAARPSQT